MKGLHLYCILPLGHRPPEQLTGVDGAPVRAMDVASLTIWFSEGERPHRPDPEALRLHDAVIRTAGSETVTPLPVRFGQWFPDEDRLAERVAESAPAHASLLQELAGTVEFGVRIVDPASPECPQGVPDPAMALGAPSGSLEGAGRKYLHGVAARHRSRARTSARGEALAGALAKHLDGRIRRTRVERGRNPDDLAEAIHLVHRRQIDRYREAIDGFRQRHPEVQFILTGPWPPYSFGA